ncbi:feruloyl esterase-like protein [Epithele typhae]|uniref:feruloyl esterase-like protein n=1 Tax=Epithele typhae TaxID=378194 RepID=UPI0020073F88|nr:feruloyl esterase-like protein [Epithele typhae]KAH9917134.1 feruloyl esterase-like protein [Epithele typhae]
MLPIVLLIASGLVLVAAAVSTPGSAAACDAFTLTNVTNVAIASVTHFDTNATVDFTNLFSSINTSVLPAFCRVELVVTTNATAGSFAITEVWLPDEWNGRMLSFGNGGVAGGGKRAAPLLPLHAKFVPSVNVADIGNIAVRQGFAGMSTNTGHNSTDSDATWGLHNDNALFDWGFRAMHLSVIAGKAVIEQYYQAPANKSYYLGCSTGGQKAVALKEVQEFPDDFDGVVLGSPANWQTHLSGWGPHMNLNVQPSTSPRFMTLDQWINVIAPEVLRQCDSLDGLADGIINDPRACRFRPETLTCRLGQNTSTCLTGPQIFALHRVYSDYVETDQTYIFGPYFPGGELEYAVSGYMSSKPDSISLSAIQNFVVNTTDFTIEDYNFDILKLIIEVNAGQAAAIKTNLTDFAGPTHSGKIIQYVGWADQLISPGASLHYYETVHTFMTEHSMLDIDDFYRLFPVAGMTHCALIDFAWGQGGVGANSFGQALNGNVPVADDAQHNIVSAIVRWVEEGVAPENFTAAKFNDDSSAKGVNFTRPVCMYPSSLVFRGGDPADMGSFECTTLV